jgi:hypothetical protein
MLCASDGVEIVDARRTISCALRISSGFMIAFLALLRIYASAGSVRTGSSLP